MTQRERSIGPVLVALFLAALFLAVFGAGFFIGAFFSLPGLGVLLDRWAHPSARPALTQDVAVERVRSVAKLVSVEYHMADFITYRDERLWPFSDRKILVLAKARVLAGFDLGRRFSVNVTETDGRKTVNVFLPRPEIISVEPEIRFHDIQGSPSPEDFDWVLRQARTTLRNEAVRTGILRKARETVRGQLGLVFPDAAS